MAKKKLRRENVPRRSGGGLLSSMRGGFQGIVRGGQEKKKSSLVGRILNILLWVAVAAMVLWRFGAFDSK
jgi:hypothetical protein